MKIQGEGPVAELLGKSAVNNWVFVAKLSGNRYRNPLFRHGRACPGMTISGRKSAPRRGQCSSMPVNKVMAIPD